MFQDPSRRKDGMNLKEAKERQVRGVPNMIFYCCSVHYYIRVFTLYRRQWVPHVSA